MKLALDVAGGFRMEKRGLVDVKVNNIDEYKIFCL